MLTATVVSSIALVLLIHYIRLSRAKAEASAALARRGYVRILTVNSPTTFYEDRDGRPAGLEHDLGTRFAERHGITAQFIQYPTIEAVLRALEEGKGDIAAAGLVKTKSRRAKFRFGPSYQRVRTELVCHRRQKLPREISQIANVNVLIANETSYEDQLEALKKRIPDIGWSTTSQSTEEILHQVWNKQVNCTIVDSNIMAINRRNYPELEVAMTIGEPQDLVWVMPGDAWGMEGLVDDFFNHIRGNGVLSASIDQYYGHLQTFDYYDAKIFIRRLETRLPRYLPVFEKEAARYGLSWRLMAAMAYQESQWDPLARSPTGVRGLMMLTLPTAEALGVDNRLDPVQSIRGGIRYFHSLRNRIPDEVNKWDRTWLALAAYNVGYGHLRDAQALAEELGKNPYRWNEVKTVLPLLSNRLYYHRLPHGYARGNEPVRYVQRIRNYELLIRVYHR